VTPLLVGYINIITPPDVFCTSPQDVLSAGAPATSRVQIDALERAHDILSADRSRAPPKNTSTGPLQGAPGGATAPPAHGWARDALGGGLGHLLLLKFLKTFTYYSLLIEYNLSIIRFTTIKKSFSATKNSGYSHFSQKFLRNFWKTFY